MRADAQRAMQDGKPGQGASAWALVDPGQGVRAAATCAVSSELRT
jgi:hypothetical protein